MWKSSSVERMEESVQVYCRVRPWQGNEKSIQDREGRAGFPVVEPREGNCAVLLDPNQTYKVKSRYDLDACWGFNAENASLQGASQAEIFSTIGPRVVSFAIDGMHSSIITFGASGCGKSHTMFGQLDSPGLCPRILNALMEWKNAKRNTPQDAVLTASFIEISLEKVHDLFSDHHTELKVRDDGKGPFLPNITIVTIDDVDAFLRRVYKTLKHLGSKMPRPHVMLRIAMEQSFEFVEGTSKLTKRRMSHITFIDCVATDRGNESGTSDAHTTLLSAQDIAKNNKALFTLRRCVEALADKSEKSKPPFRDSAMTWLMSDSLGGNCATHIVLCVSPFHRHLTDSQSTLQFGVKAKDVPTKVRVNEDEETIKLREMRNEMEGITQQLTSVSAAVSSVTQQLQQRSDKIEELTLIAEDRRLMLRKAESTNEAIDLATLAIRKMSERRMKKMRSEYEALCAGMDRLRAEVLTATQQRQKAEKSLREQEEIRFRESGIEQDILRCIMEIEESLAAVNQHHTEEKFEQEMAASKADSEEFKFSEMRADLHSEKLFAAEAEKKYASELLKIQTETAKEELEVNKLREDRDRLRKMQSFNESALAEATEFIKQTDEDIKRLTVKKQQLLQEQSVKNAGCQCLVA